MRDALGVEVTTCTALALLCCAAVSSAIAAPTTVLFGDRTIEISRTLSDPNDLWVTPDDLTRINGFVLKAEGACLDSICIPLLQDEDSAMLVTREGKEWFNVTELARKLGQVFVVDHDKSVWSFGQIPLTRGAFLQSGLAPDFELPDRNGNTVRLSDFRGKKVMIITWASW